MTLPKGDANRLFLEEWLEFGYWHGEFETVQLAPTRSSGSNMI